MGVTSRQRRRAILILVTGGRGFIGQYVCSILAARGHEVLSVDKRGRSKAQSTPDHEETRCDILDKKALFRIFKNRPISTIVHLASLLVSRSAQHPFEATQVNINGTLHLAEAAGTFNVPKVIYGSSISVYGSYRAKSAAVIDETAIPNPEDVYSAAKRYNEILFANIEKRLGIRFISLRLSSVVGLGAVNTASPWRHDIFAKLSAPRPMALLIPYCEDVALSLVYVKDVAEMVLHLIEAESTDHSIYNTPSETWVISDLARLLAELNPNLKIQYGDQRISGYPDNILAQRFTSEFGYMPVSLRQHLENHLK